MKVISSRDIIMKVKSRWDAQYSSSGSFRYDYPNLKTGLTLSGVSKALGALDLSACAPEDVDRIIGNKGWTSLTCDSCHMPVDVVVDTSGDDDDDDNLICRECLLLAIDMIETHGSEQCPDIIDKAVGRAADEAILAGKQDIDRFLDAAYGLSKSTQGNP